jgi:SWI/SNF-related matrix-associated actin-dependent regulator 1 of chromatin subfamily A
MITIFQKPFGFHIKLDKWNADIIADIKAINWQSRKYIEAERVWEVDLSHKSAVDQLKIKYNGRYVEQTEEEKIGDIPPMPKLTIDIPTRLPLRDYQKEDVAYGMEKLHFINGNQPGLGKSFEAIATIYALNAWPALIICPASLRRNWQIEWEKFVGIKAMILNDSVKKTWPTFYEMGMCKVFIVNYESLKKYFVLDIVKNEKGKFKLSNVKFNSNITLFDSVAIDELHKIKDPTTMVSKLVRGVCAKKKVVIGLTGTPIVNKPKDLVAQLLAIGQLEAVAGNYKHFMNRYCGGMAGAGATNLEELNYKLKTTCFFQRLKKDVLKDLPDKVHQIVYCDITTRDEYNKASTDLANYLKENKDKTDAEVAKSMRGEVMVKIGILKQISARGKMNEVSEYIEEIVDADEKVGVFLHHKEIANFVKEKFPSTLLYTGSQSDEEKNKAVHDFQKCKKCDIRFENHVNCDHEHVPSNNKIIALSTKAGGVGLTLTAASRMAVIELPWHPADCEQIESRFHRMSQKNSVQCTYFLGKDTIDEHIYDIIEKKRAIADTVLGVSDDRKFVDDFIKDYNDGKIKL